MKSKFIKLKGRLIKIVKINGNWFYKNHYCEFCGKRILVPNSNRGLQNHRQRGIPNNCPHHNQTCFKRGHKSFHTKEGDKKISKSLIGNTRAKGNHSRSGTRASEEARKNMSIAQKRYYLKHPNTNQLRNARAVCLSKKTSIELKVCSELDILKIAYLTNVLDIIGTPDIVIPNIKTGHPIIIFCDGCYWHGCLKCFPMSKTTNEIWMVHSQFRHRDKKITKKLIKLGYIVIRIWEHDIRNGNFKKVIHSLIDR